MDTNNYNLQGLTDKEVEASRIKSGKNVLEFKKENEFFNSIKRIAAEPMVVLLLVAASIYFISGKIGDAFFLLGAILLVVTISLYQFARSKNALSKLKEFIKPNSKVIRNNAVIEIKTEDLVVGDYLIVEEGVAITADATIIHSNDLTLNESILTGESFPLAKDKHSQDNNIYSGTSVSSGMAIASIFALGNSTKIGKIGKSLEAIEEEKTPLELQIGNFVKKMVLLGALVFIAVWGINFYNSREILDSLLKALTLAMSIMPEEIPVAFTTFMALGAWRLMKMGIVVKQMKTVETLGSATVICTDKTGTITENKMSLAKLYVLSSNTIADVTDELDIAFHEIITTAMWASEPVPFDPMEIAIHAAYGSLIDADERPNFKLEHEYPLSGKPPMMTHVFENVANATIIAAKGAPEAFLEISGLTQQEKENVKAAITTLTVDGFRVLAVAKSTLIGRDFPAEQQQLPFVFIGLVAFYDPPKKNINAVLNHFYSAGISVKIITGDNAQTTAAIAKQVNFSGTEKSISGEELMLLSTHELSKCVAETNLFTRMFPEAKLKVIEALKLNGEIVAMTGDGVNDGPALKAAHIGIAMGKKGTEIAKQAASLILVEDDLSKMVDAIAMGRKIYTNLKKAIQYIISIHIPIILTVFIPLIAGWLYPNILSPVHIIFLELIMGPTCSIIYENEPIEKDTMLQKPRPFTSTFFSWKELTTSIIQGVCITLGTLFIYWYAVSAGYSESLTRTMVFTVLVSANIFLTLINRSFYYSVFTTLGYKNRMVLLIISATSFLLFLMLFITPITQFFEFEKLNTSQFFLSFLIGFLSVIWFEIVKWWKRNK